MAIERLNLCLEPATKWPGGPTWLVPTATVTDWNRSTAMHATLPRTTGMAGTTAAVLRTPPAPVVPGRPYVGSLWMRSTVANNGGVRFEWYAADDTSLGLSAATSYNQAAATTAQLSTGPHTAPAGAAYCRIHLEVDGAAQLTAVLIEQTSTAGAAYFDGDTPGARWVGADGQSVSMIGTAEVVAESLSYDHELGRVRVVPAGTPGPGVGRIMVRRRATTSNVFEQVRGGDLPVFGGVAVRSGDDYEFPADQDLIYRLELHVGAEDLPTERARGPLPLAPLAAAEVFYRPPLARAWLKFVANPILNRRVTVIGPLPEVSRPGRNSVYEVRERTDPVIVTAGHGSRRMTLRLRTFTRDETEALDTSLKQGIPAFLHLPPSTPIPSMYAVVGDYSYVAPSQRSQGAVWSVPLVEVSPPPLSIYATGATWSTVLAEHATWAELLASAASWRGVQ